MKKQIYLLIFAILFLLSSCKKALVETPHSILTAQTFFKTKADAYAALYGVFAILQQQNYYQRTVYLISDISADLIKPANTNSDRVQLNTGTYTPSNGQIYNWWIKPYSLIQRANDVLAYVPQISSTEISESEKNNILGNASFLRGFAYFNLVKSFGDVPLVIDSKNGDLFPVRTPAQQVYDQVISDLKFAEQNCVHLHEIPADKIGLASSEASSALLARVYLQKASTSFGTVADNQSALEYCSKVIAYSAANAGAFTLVSDYASIFNPDLPNGKECLFSVQFGIETLNITKQMFNPSTLGGFGSLIGQVSYYESFKADDNIRRTVNIGNTNNSFRYISKYQDPGVAPGSFGRNNFIVLRYADVLLMQSEAMNNINPGNNMKFDGINKVRLRAMPAAIPLSLANTPGPADFVTALVNERAWEFGVEGHRRWDLIRLKRFQQIKLAQGYTIDNNHLLFPIPQSEIDLNRNLVQNPGY